MRSIYCSGQERSFKNWGDGLKRRTFQFKRTIKEVNTFFGGGGLMGYGKDLINLSDKNEL